MKTTSSIETIVRAGGSVIIDSSIMTTSIEKIVRAASPTSQIIIKNADKMMVSSIEKIAKAANGKTVIFDLT